jgi:choice-of-anchor B domain-containing protein
LNSIWRDIKVYDDYAYVTTEADEGLVIIDLSPLPYAGFSTLDTSIYTGPASDPWLSAHNLFEADGYVYIFGANRDNGGVIILDVATDPLNPIEIGTFENWYCHDGVVQNDTGYFGHVNDGFFSIVDLADKANITGSDIIGTLSTSSNFTHNCWPSLNGQYLFTTDEVANGYLDSYDITTPSSPVLLDQIQSSPGSDIIPHNAHVLNDYLITSYYTDGVVVHDISDPSNMVEIANFDTSPDYNGDTFNGCWGVYPYFSSLNIVASDIEKGLYILGLNPTLSSYLQGDITSAGTGQPINNALIEILTTPTTDNSGTLGDYSIGTTNQGLYEVRYSANGYYADTLDINCVNGTIVTQDVALQQVPLFTATITVIDQTTLLPVENAHVKLEHTLQDFNGLTDANGEISFDLFYEDNYKLTAGIWEYENECYPNIMITATNNTIEVPILEGVYDDFTFDYGWTTSGNATAGDWVRETPVGTEAGGQFVNPYFDDFNDCSTYAFLTGNGASNPGGDDVDDGFVQLQSPLFDLTSYSYPHIVFSYWFYNGLGGGSTPNDSLTIHLSNGSTNVQVASLGLNNATISEWEAFAIDVADLMTPTNQMQLTFTATDYSPGHVLKAGIDFLRIGEHLQIEKTEEQSIHVFPNPATSSINIIGINSGTIEIHDLSGRLMLNTDIQPTIEINNLTSGLYIVRIKAPNGDLLKTLKQEIR